ncbi:YceI family protein [Chondrinema litorale]|uniref:YceI family protein n=1 Tax=Chondrinema litorale TaxID=2994555 RepID=UPI002543AB74|nr:YceI family protein [Chondrinema litorale]UZR94509.1 YceI family protein [Chondrinema litorale]
MRPLYNIIQAVIIGSLLIAQPLFGQDNYKVDNDNSTMTVSGTSTLHDWESDVENKTVTFTANTNGDQVTINNLELNVEVASIKSGKGAMDDKTYEALKESKFPNITFKLSEPVTVNKSGTVVAKGVLNLAGVKKEIAVNGNITVDNNAQIAIKGSYKINLNDYNITPPTAMFGTIKTGEEITVGFDLNLTKEPNN